jgi:hypothetical protein
MNARMERVRNSEIFWHKNHGKWSSGYKDMALEELEGKMVFLEGFGGYLWNF